MACQVVAARMVVEVFQVALVALEADRGALDSLQSASSRHTHTTCCHRSVSSALQPGADEDRDDNRSVSPL